MPRTEHIDQLKEQMQPCVSPALYSQLFHDDFKHHITALVTLTKVCLVGGGGGGGGGGCLQLQGIKGQQLLVVLSFRLLLADSSL